MEAPTSYRSYLILFLSVFSVFIIFYAILVPNMQSEWMLAGMAAERCLPANELVVFARSHIITEDVRLCQDSYKQVRIESDNVIVDCTGAELKGIMLKSRHNNIELRNCRIKDGSISLSGSNIILSDNIFEKTKVDLLEVVGADVLNNKFLGRDGVGSGLRLQGSSVRVYGNLFDCGETNDKVIELVSSHDSEIVSNYILDTCLGAGISGSGKRMLILDNNIKSGKGVMLTDSQVVGIISNVVLPSGRDSGIVLSSVAGAYLINNTINSSAGVLITGSVHILMQDNSICGSVQGLLCENTDNGVVSGTGNVLNGFGVSCMSSDFDFRQCSDEEIQYENTSRHLDYSMFKSAIRKEQARQEHGNIHGNIHDDKYDNNYDDRDAIMGSGGIILHSEEGHLFGERYISPEWMRAFIILLLAITMGSGIVVLNYYRERAQRIALPNKVDVHKVIAKYDKSNPDIVKDVLVRSGWHKDDVEKAIKKHHRRGK